MGSMAEDIPPFGALTKDQYYNWLRDQNITLQGITSVLKLQNQAFLEVNGGNATEQDQEGTPQYHAEKQKLFWEKFKLLELQDQLKTDRQVFEKEKKEFLAAKNRLGYETRKNSCKLPANQQHMAPTNTQKKKALKEQQPTTGQTIPKLSVKKSVEASNKQAGLKQGNCQDQAGIKNVQNTQIQKKRSRRGKKQAATN